MEDFDDKETQTIQDLDISGKRAGTVREWLKTSAWILGNVLMLTALVTLIFWGIPTLNAVKDSSKATAKGWEETINTAGVEIQGMAVKGNEAMGEVKGATQEGRRLVKGLADEVPPAIRELRESVGDLRAEVKSLSSDTRALITDFNHRLSGDEGLMVELTGFARKVGTNIDGLTAELNALIGAGKLTFDQLRTLISDPAISTAIAEFASAMGHLDGSSAKVEEAMGHFEVAMRDSPLFVKNVNEILAEVKKIAATTSKYAKATILARIFSLIAGALIP